MKALFLPISVLAGILAGVISKKLFALVWGQQAGSVRTVDNFVGQLRKRLETDPEQPRHFITVRGSGYRFDP